MSAKDAHVHYWKIEAARGSRALAYCRDCPATRSFATGWIGDRVELSDEEKARRRAIPAYSRTTDFWTRGVK